LPRRLRLNLLDGPGVRKGKRLADGAWPLGDPATK
jgi:hypothetical protein